MRESILTIPINEIFEPKEGCPICRMRDILEKRTVDYIMGAAMMEPDVRIETNRLGFCHTHFEQMLEKKNRLSLALMLQTHLEELNKEVFSKKGLFEPRARRQQLIKARNESCFVCSKVEWAMQRLMVTVFDMFENSKDFAKLYSEQEYICMPHCEQLIYAADSALNKRMQADFKDITKELSGRYAAALYEDVSHFCRMFDYRNSGKDADWGNSRDSVERAIRFLTSR